MPQIAARTSRWSKADLLAALDVVGVPAGPINTLPEVFADAQVVHREIATMLPSGSGGSMPALRTPIMIDGIAQVAMTPAPALGTTAPNWRDAR